MSDKLRKDILKGEVIAANAFIKKTKNLGLKKKKRRKRK